MRRRYQIRLTGGHIGINWSQPVCFMSSMTDDRQLWPFLHFWNIYNIINTHYWRIHVFDSERYRVTSRTKWRKYDLSACCTTKRSEFQIPSKSIGLDETSIHVYSRHNSILLVHISEHTTMVVLCQYPASCIASGPMWEERRTEWHAKEKQSILKIMNAMLCQRDTEEQKRFAPVLRLCVFARSARTAQNKLNRKRISRGCMREGGAE